MKQQWAESTYRKTKSWKSNPQFDNILSEEDISGLRYLEEVYEKRINNYKQSHDLSNRIYYNEYKYLEINHGMIEQEIYMRTMDNMASPTLKSISVREMDSDTGVIYNNYGSPIQSIDFNENETGIILRDLEGNVLNDSSKELIDYNIKLSKSELYKDWDYWIEDV